MASIKPNTPHHHGSGFHLHPVPLTEKTPSRKEKLIIRLERYVQLFKY